MKTLLTLFMVFIIGSKAYAQTVNNQEIPNGIINGKLTDQKDLLPLPYVTVSVRDTNAKIILTVISDDKGVFRLRGLPIESLSLQFSLMGYQTINSTITLSAASHKVDLGNISMVQDAKALGEVSVTAEKPGISLKLGKKVFEVGKDILAQSGSVNDILNSVPSVAVNPEGAVSLRGNNNVTVLINGRQSGLTQSNSLDQIPAGLIEKVEVITNPSSRYDAGGSAGILNIILKKNKVGGFSGQLKAVVGIPNETRVNPSLNYKSDKINLFSTLGIRLSDYKGFYSSDQTSSSNGQINYLLQTQNENRHDDAKLIYLGADYQINTHNVITAAYFKNATKDHDNSLLNYQYNSNGLNGALLRNAESWEKRDYNQIEFNYTRTFDDVRKKFTVDMQYDFWNSDKKWDLNTEKTRPINEKLAGIRTRSIGSSKDFLLQTDFVQALNERMLLELGLKAEKRSVITDFNAEQQQGDEWLIYNNINNKLEYDELIGSAYAQLSNKGKKFSYMMGLRSELTKISIEDRGDTYRNDKNYTGLFPSLNLGYQITESSTAQFSYSKRINRPSLWMIYPFNELTDLNSQYMGNPNLNPSYADVLEIGLLKYWRALTFNPSIYYQNNSDFIQDYTYRNADIFYTTPINIEREVRTGIELSLLYSPLKWLQMNAELNAYNYKQEGLYLNQDFNFKGHILTGRLSAHVKYAKILNVQARYNFTGPQNNAQAHKLAIHNLDIGLSTNVFKDKATLSFDGVNILNSRKMRTTTTGENYVFNQLSNSNAARYRLTFVYRFNLKDNNAIRQAKSGNRN